MEVYLTPDQTRYFYRHGPKSKRERAPYLGLYSHLAIIQYPEGLFGWSATQALMASGFSNSGSGLCELLLDLESWEPVFELELWSGGSLGSTEY